MKKKYRFLIEKWSDQPVIELTDEEFEKFKEMNIEHQADFLEDKCSVSYNIVNIELTVTKKDIQDV